MAKRFFNTSRIEEDWYLDLSLKHRELLRYCESKCDGAGIFSFNSKIATTYIGEKVTEQDLAKIPVSKLDNGKYFIVGFCFFQNGILSEKSPAHKPVFKSLQENKTDEKTLSNTLSDSLSNRLQEEEREEEKEIVKEEEKEKPKEKTEFEITFSSFLEMRKKIKKPATERAIELIHIELEKLAPANEKLKIDILNQSIKNCYQDVYPLKVNTIKPQHTEQQPVVLSSKFNG